MTDPNSPLPSTAPNLTTGRGRDGEQKGQQHTIEPWEPWYDPKWGYSIIGGIEELSNGAPVRRDVVERFAGWRPDAENGANADRIVACVNGCEGIADPSAVPDLLEVAQLLVQADCFGSSGPGLSRYDIGWQEGDIGRKAMRLAREAVAKATASAPFALTDHPRDGDEQENSTETSGRTNQP